MVGRHRHRYRTHRHSLDERLYRVEQKERKRLLHAAYQQVELSLKILLDTLAELDSYYKKRLEPLSLESPERQALLAEHSQVRWQVQLAMEQEQQK